MREILLVARTGAAQMLLLVALMFAACGQKGGGAGEGEPCNAEIPCGHGLICSGGICVVDLCAAVECELGEVCANGLCVSRNCEDRVCPEGLVCIDGDCVASSCVGVMCPADHACADGRCYPNDCPETYCGSGVCVNGECVPRSCVGVPCPEGQACGLGECYPVDCTLPCAPNEVCVGGQCTAISCVGVTCPAGTLCGLGLCWPVYCDDRDCPSGEVCVDGECTLPSCVGVVCPEGYACAAGECRLEACSEELCGPGEVCDEQLGTCVVKACYGRVCPEGAICVAGGACVSVDCDERECDEGDVCDVTGDRCVSLECYGKCPSEQTCLGDVCVDRQVVSCDASGTPPGGTATIEDVEIIWDDQEGWSDAEDCEWSGDEMELVLHRFDGGTGPVLVSSGIMLLPAQLLEDKVEWVAVAVDGAEVPAYVEALDGRHTDGSVVSVLIQFEADPDTSSAELSFGTPPTQARLTKTPIDFRPGADMSDLKANGYPAAVAVPPLEHLVSAFKVFGPTISVADAIELGEPFARLESTFATWSDRKWNEFQDTVASAGDPRGMLVRCGDFERGLHHFAWFARTADPKYLLRGSTYAFAFRFHYYEYNDYVIDAQWLWWGEGLAAHYWLTGDEESREAVGRLARLAYGDPETEEWSFNRMRQCDWPGQAEWVTRSLSAMTWAYRLGLNEVDWRGATLAYVDLIVSGGVDGPLWSTDPADDRYGAWLERHPYYPEGSECSVEYVLNFANVQLLDSLISVHEHVQADDRILEIVRRNLDYLCNTQWRGAEGNNLQIVNGEPSPSFNFANVRLAGVAVQGPSVDLSGLYIHVLGWYANHSGNPFYWEIAEQALDTLSRHPDGTSGPWLSGEKQYNQAFWKAWQLGAFAP